MEDDKKRDKEIPDFMFFNRPNYSHITLKNFGYEDKIMECLEREERIKFNKQRNKYFNRIDNRYFDDYNLITNRNNDKYNKNGVKKEFEINKKFMQKMFFKKPSKREYQNSQNFLSDNIFDYSLNKPFEPNNTDDNEIYSISDKKLNNPEKDVFIRDELTEIEEVYPVFTKQTTPLFEKLLPINKNQSNEKRIKKLKNNCDYNEYSEDYNKPITLKEKEKISQEMPKLQSFNKSRNLNYNSHTNESSYFIHNHIKNELAHESEFEHEIKPFRNKNTDSRNLTIQKNYNIQNTYDINIENFNIDDNYNLIRKKPKKMNNKVYVKEYISENTNDSIYDEFNYISKNGKVSNNSNIFNKGKNLSKMNQAQNNNNNANGSGKYSYTARNKNNLEYRNDFKDTFPKTNLIVRNGCFLKSENLINTSDSDDDSDVLLERRNNTFDGQLNQQEFEHDYINFNKRPLQWISREENGKNNLYDKIRYEKECINNNYKTSNFSMNNKYLVINKEDSSAEETKNNNSNCSHYQSDNYQKNNFYPFSTKQNFNRKKSQNFKSAGTIHKNLLNVSDSTNSEVLGLNEKPFEANNKLIKNPNKPLFPKAIKRDLMLIDLVSENSDHEGQEFKSTSETSIRKNTKNYLTSCSNIVNDEFIYQDFENFNVKKNKSDSARNKLKSLKEEEIADIPIRKKNIKPEAEEQQTKTKFRNFQLFNFNEFSQENDSDSFIPKKNNFNKSEANKIKNVNNDFAYQGDSRRLSLYEGQNPKVSLEWNHGASEINQKFSNNLNCESEVKFNKFKDNYWNDQGNIYTQNFSKPVNTDIIDLVDEYLIEESDEKNPKSNNQNCEFEHIQPKSGKNKTPISPFNQVNQNKPDVITIENFIQNKNLIVSRKPIDKKLLTLDFIPFKNSYQNKDKKAKCHDNGCSRELKLYANGLKSPMRYYNSKELYEEIHVSKEKGSVNEMDESDEGMKIADDVIENKRKKILNRENNHYLTSHRENGESNFTSNNKLRDCLNTDSQGYQSEKKSDKLDEEFLMNNTNIYTVKSDRRKRRKRTNNKDEEFNPASSNSCDSEETRKRARKSELSKKKCLRCNNQKHTETANCTETINSKCTKCQNLNHTAENCLIERSHSQRENEAEAEAEAEGKNTFKNVICMICGKFGHAFCPMELKVFEDFNLNEDSSSDISSDEEESSRLNSVNFESENEGVKKKKCEICYENHDTQDCKFPKNAFREINNSSNFLYEHKQRILFRKNFTGNPDSIPIGPSRLINDKNFFYSNSENSDF